MGGGLLLAFLLSAAVQPHSLMDLLFPTTVQLQDETGQVVYTQKVRLNAVVLPDNLKPGRYSMYVNGVHKDDLSVDKSTAEMQSNSQPTTRKGVVVKTVDGLQAVTWDTETPNFFSFLAGPEFKQAGQEALFWIKQQKVFWSEVNTAMFAGAALLALAILTFHASALAASIVRSSSGWLAYLRNGWVFFPYTIIGALVTTVSLGGISVLLIGIIRGLSVPYAENVETGIAFFVVATVSCRTSALASGKVRTGIALLCSLAPALIVALLASNTLVTAVLFSVGVLLLPAVAGTTGTPRIGGISDVVDIEAEEDEAKPKNEAWRETLQ